MGHSTLFDTTLRPLRREWSGDACHMSTADDSSLDWMSLIGRSLAIIRLTSIRHGCWGGRWLCLHPQPIVISVGHRVDRGTCPPLSEKNLHDFAADTRLYMCELLVWLCHVLISVWSKSSVCINTDWSRYLLDGGFRHYSTNSLNWHFVYIIFVHAFPPHLLPCP